MKNECDTVETLLLKAYNSLMLITTLIMNQKGVINIWELYIDDVFEEPLEENSTRWNRGSLDNIIKFKMFQYNTLNKCNWSDKIPTDILTMSKEKKTSAFEKNCSSNY